MKLIKFNTDKKAQLFTVMVILILSLTFVSIEIFSSLHSRDTVKTRISSMDNFLFSSEENLERQLYISCYRILFLAEDEITTSGNYINVNDFFNEAFFNGTVDGVSSDILIGATYGDLINSLNQKASKINVNITMNNSIIKISQENPWFVKFSLISNFTMQDKGDLALWEKQQEIFALVPVEGFEDPLYIVNTFGKISKVIKRTPYEGNYVNAGDVSNLISHVDGGYYSNNSGAPSFLMRLEGNLSSDENGIESFVDIPLLTSQGLPVNTKSDIDYIYFSSDNPAYYSVSGMPSWFRIDGEDNHIDKYQVSGLTS